jgi:transposase
MVELTDTELDRYARHIVLPQVGGVGQRKLKASSFAVIGAGGIGSAAIPAFAGGGIGKLTIIDDGEVERSNLQRQTIFRDDQVGKPKAALAAEFARALNPHVNAMAVQQRLDTANVETLIAGHDLILDQLTRQSAPSLREGFGIGADTAAEMLIVLGDNPERIRSEAAFSKLCGASPIPASSGMTDRHRLSRGGHRQANAALYRVVIVRMRFHQPTIDYVARRRAEGRSKRDIIRCLKRFLAREIYRRVMTDHRARAASPALS